MLSLHLNTTLKELPLIYEFMQYVFQVIQLWFRIFPLQLYKPYDKSFKHKRIYLVDFESALSRCGHEFIDILAKCFGLCNRCLTLYKNFGDAYYFKGLDYSVPYFPERGFGLMYSLMNAFGELGGVESVKKFLL